MSAAANENVPIVISKAKISLFIIRLQIFKLKLKAGEKGTVEGTLGYNLDTPKSYFGLTRSHRVIS